MFNLIYNFLYSLFDGFEMSYSWIVGGVSTSLPALLSLIGSISILTLIVFFMVKVVIWFFKAFAGLVR